MSEENVLEYAKPVKGRDWLGYISLVFAAACYTIGILIKREVIRGEDFVSVPYAVMWLVVVGPAAVGLLFAIAALVSRRSDSVAGWIGLVINGFPVVISFTG